MFKEGKTSCHNLGWLSVVALWLWVVLDRLGGYGSFLSRSAF